MSSWSESGRDRILEWAFLSTTAASALVAAVAAASVEKAPRLAREEALALLAEARAGFERSLSAAQQPVARTPEPATATVAADSIDPVVIRSPEIRSPEIRSPETAVPAPSRKAAPGRETPKAKVRPPVSEVAETTRESRHREAAVEKPKRAEAREPKAARPEPPAAKVPARLSALGLTARDLEGAGMGSGLDRWGEATGPEKARIEEELDKALLADAFLDRLFRETADALDRRAGQSGIAAQENEYLNLRTARRPGLDEDARRGLRRRILALRAALR